jgi:hypothetical protein
MQTRNTLAECCQWSWSTFSQRRNIKAVRRYEHHITRWFHELFMQSVSEQSIPRSRVEPRTHLLPCTVLWNQFDAKRSSSLQLFLARLLFRASSPRHTAYISARVPQQSWKKVTPASNWPVSTVRSLSDAINLLRDSATIQTRNQEA